MRFVAVKSAEKQSAGMTFKTRDLLVRQKTQAINAVRGHLAEHGVIAPQGVAHLGRLAAAVEESGALPPEVIELCGMLLDHIAVLDRRITELDRKIRDRARTDDTARRLMSIPGIGPISAVALEALAPPAETFTKGRDFAACSVSPLGRTPQAARRDWERHRKWANVTYDGCSSSAPRPWCNGRGAKARRLDLGSRACWPESRACWSRSHWRTGWPVSLGP